MLFRVTTLAGVVRCSGGSPEANGLLQKTRAVALESNAVPSLDEFARSVALVEEQARQGDPPSTAEMNSLTEMVITLEKSFEQQLYTETDDDQSAWDAALAKHALCAEHKEKRLSPNGDVTKAWNAISTWNTKHTLCRKAHKSSTNLQTVAGVVKNSSWSSLIGAAAGHSRLAELATVCDLRNAFISDLDDYEDAAPTFSVALSCAVEQAAVETGFCSWLALKTGACLAFDDCVFQLDLGAFKNQLLERRTQRISVFTSLQKLKCRLQHIFDTYSTTGGASNATLVDECDDVHLTILVPDDLDLKLILPDTSQCGTESAPTHCPCSTDADITDAVQPSTTNVAQCSAWKSQEYTFSLKTHTAADGCQATCSIPETPAEASSVDPNCVDQNDPTSACAFYDRHPDACGLYHEAKDLVCCSCGSTPWASAGTHCNAGQQANVAGTACIDCPDGTISGAGGICTECPEGQTSNAGHTACVGAEEYCAEACQAQGYCCNDPSIGSNQMISCAQACMMRAAGTPAAQLVSSNSGYCDRQGDSGCSLTVADHSYSFCQKCNDLKDSCPHGVTDKSECDFGASLSPPGFNQRW